MKLRAKLFIFALLMFEAQAFGSESSFMTARLGIEGKYRSLATSSFNVNTSFRFGAIAALQFELSPSFAFRIVGKGEDIQFSPPGSAWKLTGGSEFMMSYGVEALWAVSSRFKLVPSFIREGFYAAYSPAGAQAVVEKHMLSVPGLKALYAFLMWDQSSIDIFSSIRAPVSDASYEAGIQWELGLRLNLKENSIGTFYRSMDSKLAGKSFQDIQVGLNLITHWRWD